MWYFSFVSLLFSSRHHLVTSQRTTSLWMLLCDTFCSGLKLQWSHLLISSIFLVTDILKLHIEVIIFIALFISPQITSQCESQVTDILRLYCESHHHWYHMMTSFCCHLENLSNNYHCNSRMEPLNDYYMKIIRWLHCKASCGNVTNLSCGISKNCTVHKKCWQWLSSRSHAGNSLLRWMHPATISRRHEKPYYFIVVF